ncbi:MAG: hypothetical protein ACKO38_12200 [Planctomycetota bacterium]
MINVLLRKRRHLVVGLFSVIVVGALIFAFMSLSSCEPDQIASNYGQRRGSAIQESVNGTLALSRLFEQKGHTVASWRRLSPRIRSYDTLVWIPDLNSAPSRQERDFLDAWLDDGVGRTLIYVGRDYDVASLYWQKMQSKAPADQISEINERLKSAGEQHNAALANGPHLAYARWFVIKPGPHYPVTGLNGPWADGVDASALDISVGTRLVAATNDSVPVAGTPLPVFTMATSPPTKATTPNVPPANPGTAGGTGAPAPPKAGKNTKVKKLAASPLPFSVAPVGNAEQESRPVPNSEVLLETDRGDPLVRRVYDGPAPYTSTPPATRRSQVIVVTNGAFLLNMGLVNHEHRKLAARLVEACGPPGNVAFLESGPTGLAVLDKEPENTMPSGMGLFTIYPLNVLLLHLIGVGLLFCFTVWPIFGRAKRLPAVSVSDFGAHVEAVGDLLEQTHDKKTARLILENYQKTTKETR